MPLTKKGKQILKNFKRRYKQRGEEVFYRFINKNPRITKSWHSE